MWFFSSSQPQVLPVLQFYLGARDARPLHGESPTHVGQPVPVIPDLGLHYALHPLSRAPALTLPSLRLALAPAPLFYSLSLTRSLSLDMTCEHRAVREQKLTAD